jgi:hypothetical protein
LEASRVAVADSLTRTAPKPGTTILVLRRHFSEGYFLTPIGLCFDLAYNLNLYLIEIVNSNFNYIRIGSAGRPHTPLKYKPGTCGGGS